MFFRTFLFCFKGYSETLKENSIIDRSWSPAKLFKMQDYTENANGDMPLIV